MIRLESYLGGVWRAGDGEGRAFINPTSGETLGLVDSTNVNVAAGVAYARETGGRALRAMTFAERGSLLGAIADALVSNRADYADIARRNSGNTARDVSIDIDGGVVTLKFYARLGKALGDAFILVEDGVDQLTKSENFGARHIWTSRPGVAIHINAFNFPSWGLWEKVAVAILAGAPVVAKPASASAWLSERMVRDVVSAGFLPPGVLSIVCGSAEGLLGAVEPFDGIVFTGSAETGLTIRRHSRVVEKAPRLAVEADSLNVALLGPAAGADGEALKLLVREVTAALTVKAGQLCTNIRRVLIPVELISRFADAATAEIDRIICGDPALAEVTLGPVLDERQRRSVLAGLERLKAEAKIVRGGGAPVSALGADPSVGSFVSPTLLLAGSAQTLSAVHETEVFGPVVTVIPYSGRDEAVSLALRGGGSLAASIYSDDTDEAGRLAIDLAALHGRILCVDPNVGSNHTGHAIVMPQCVHGGPGRAGGGEELGGLRGLRFYMQRTALQGSRATLEGIASAAALRSL